MAKLNYPILDPNNEEELIERAMIEVYNLSNQVINDFSSSAPHRVLIEALVFCIAEMLYYVNQILLALTVSFFENTGVTREEGNKSTALQTFYLSLLPTSAVIIPANTEVTSDGGELSFYTTKQLIIPAGVQEGAVTVIAKEPGSAYNLPALTINNLLQPIPFISFTTNLESSFGGTDPETDEDAITRGQREIRIKNLISADDFEIAGEAILGDGSTIKAVGLLGLDKVSKELGATHLFVLNRNGLPATDAEIKFLNDELNAISKPTMSLARYISPAEIVDIKAEVILTPTNEIQNLDQVSEEIWRSLLELFNPKNFKQDKQIFANKIITNVANNTGVDLVHYVTMNDKALDFNLRKDFEFPRLTNLRLMHVIKGLIEPIVYEYEIEGLPHTE